MAIEYLGCISNSIIKALGDKNLTLSFDKNNDSWSPNQYKKIFILLDGILVEKHSPEKLITKTVSMSTDLVLKDLETYGTANRDTLVSFINRWKVLSCLEEIVISKTIYTRLAALTGSKEVDFLYSATVKNNLRLRQLTVCDDYRVSDVEKILYQTYNSGRVHFLFSDITKPLDTKQTDRYNNYYEFYNLRPSHYAWDGKTSVEKYFRGIFENELRGKANSELLRNALEFVGNDLNDVDYLEVYRHYITVFAVCRYKSNAVREFAKKLIDLVNNHFENPKYYTEGLKEALEALGTKTGEKVEILNKYYEEYKLKDKKSTLSKPKKDQKSYLDIERCIWSDDMKKLLKELNDECHCLDDLKVTQESVENFKAILERIHTSMKDTSHLKAREFKGFKDFFKELKLGKKIPKAYLETKVLPNLETMTLEDARKHAIKLCYLVTDDPKCPYDFNESTWANVNVRLFKYIRNNGG